MNAILGMTSLALETRLDDEQKDYLQTVETSARELLHLLNEILDYSKVESGRFAVENVAYEPAALIDGVRKAMEPLALVKCLDLRTSIDPNLPRLLVGDPARIRQVLLNLLSNAIKFTERGWVDCSVQWVHSAPGGGIRYCVADTGIGIAAEKREIVFEAFRQADGSTTRQYGGTGLGLSISKKLVEAMGGRIELRSELGRGSEFIVELPLVLPDDAVRPVSGQPDRQVESSLVPLQTAVLLVEDNAVSRRLAARVLEKMGCRVTVAQDGDSAISLLKAGQFDIVLMDLHMPGTDGIQATKEIRILDAKANSHTPIVILTASVNVAEKQRALDTGADAFLTKPLDVVELHHALSRFETARHKSNK